MRRWTRFALPVALLTVLAACNSAAHGGKETSPGTPATGGCPTNLAITAADSGHSGLCVALGGKVTVTLDTPAGAQWRPVEASGSALAPASVTAPPQVPSTVMAQFTAVAKGSSVISSCRPNCPSAAPGQVRCNSISQWQVTVEVK